MIFNHDKGFETWQEWQTLMDSRLGLTSVVQHQDDFRVMLEWLSPTGLRLFDMILSKGRNSKTWNEISVLSPLSRGGSLVETVEFLCQV